MKKFQFEVFFLLVTIIILWKLYVAIKITHDQKTMGYVFDLNHQVLLTQGCIGKITTYVYAQLLISFYVLRLVFHKTRAFVPLELYRF